jgi:glycosyltransferase involved in cell wall biosynthesis
MKTGDGEGRLPIKPARSPIDIFDDAEVATLIGGLANVLIPQATAGEVIDRRSAARYVISLLRCNAEIRARFPNALSSGAEGDFARWIDAEGATTLGLGERARYFVRNILGVDFAARVRQAYLVRTDLRRLMPFALLPDGAGSLITWGMHDGVREGFSLEEVWWLALLCREDPTGALITTYSFSPSWQFNHRMALTVFGAASFLSWLRREFDIDPPFEAEVLAKATLPADAIRIAWQNTASWQHEHPAPFKTVDSASTFLDWLGTSNVALPREALAWTLSLDRAAVVSELVRPGVNMIGHFCYPSGLKTSTEALVKGADEAGLSFTERDIWVQQPGDENNHWKFRGWELFDTTIMLCQPEPLFDVAYARAGLAPRTRPPYMIGYWYWEQEEIPDQWLEQVAKLDEIWTSTHFVGDALKKKIGKPVQVIPHGIELQPYERRTRSFFALPEDHFLFLFTFHMMSVMERKNPLGLIEAFRKQFRPGEKVGLVLKTSFGDHHPRQMEELRRAAAGANITIIDSVYSKADILALMDSCDAYVSLHRSEGFGLTMAEAMLVGRPTIATGYSANLDFMTPENSLLVDYDLITLDRDYPPYKAGSRWAKASLDHAGQCMRRLVEDREYARALGKRGREDLQRNMSFLASGRMIVNRLAEIDRLRSADASRSTGLIIS